MYKVTLNKNEIKSNHDLYLVELFAENHEDLRAIVTLAPGVGYEIVSVKETETPLQTVSEFLEEIKDKIKPKDLVFGNFKSEGYDTIEESYEARNKELTEHCKSLSTRLEIVGKDYAIALEKINELEKKKEA